MGEGLRWRLFTKPLALEVVGKNEIGHHARGGKTAPENIPCGKNFDPCGHCKVPRGGSILAKIRDIGTLGCVLIVAAWALGPAPAGEIPAMFAALRRRLPTRSITRPESACATCQLRSISYDPNPLGENMLTSNDTHESARTQFVQIGDVRFAYRRFGRYGGLPVLRPGFETPG